MTLRLVATDLDGTLLRSDATVSQRTLDVVASLAELGVPVVPVTARAPRSVRALAAEIGIRGHAICGSGSIVYDLDRDVLIEDHPLDVEIAARLVAGLRAAVPGIVFAAERDLRWVREPAYGAPVLPIADISEEDALEFVRSPVTKLVAKHPALGREALVEAARAVAGADAHVGHSGAGPTIEIIATGATKAATLERHCARLGIARDEVVAFGDWPIDIPMLAWAGRGVAPSNAHPDVIAAADDICAPNDDEGVARYLEELIRSGDLAS